MTAPDVTDQQDATEAKRVQDEVVATSAAYLSATKDRVRFFREMRDKGRSFYWLAKATGLSTARVSQILDTPEKRRERAEAKARRRAEAAEGSA